MLPSAVPGGGARVRADVPARPAMRWAAVARPPPPRVQLQEGQGRQEVRRGWVPEAPGDAFPAAPLAGLLVVLVSLLGRLGEARAPPAAAVVLPASDALRACGEPPPPHVQDKIRGRQDRRRGGRVAAPQAAGAALRGAPAADPRLVLVLGVLLGLRQEPARGAVASPRSLPAGTPGCRGGEPARERDRTRGVPRPGAVLEHAGVGGHRPAPAAAQGHGEVLLGQCARGSSDQRLRLRAPVHALLAGEGEEVGQGEGRRRPQQEQAGEAGHGAERSTGLGSGHAGNNASDSSCPKFFVASLPRIIFLAFLASDRSL